MTKPTDHNAKAAASPAPSQTRPLAVNGAKATPAAVPAAPATAKSPAPLPKSWAEIQVGSLVLAHEGLKEGWWEAVVTEMRGDVLTLRWRDYPDLAAIARNRKEVALLFCGN